MQKGRLRGEVFMRQIRIRQDWIRGEKELVFQLSRFFPILFCLPVRQIVFFFLDSFCQPLLHHRLVV